MDPQSWMVTSWFLNPLAGKSHHILRLIKWNREFSSVKSTQEALWLFSWKEALLEWLGQHVGVGVINVYDYVVLLKDSLSGEPKPVIACAHFLYHSLSKLFLSTLEVKTIGGYYAHCKQLWICHKTQKWILVPANGNKWAGLTIKFMEKKWLSWDYLRSGGQVLVPANGT